MSEILAIDTSIKNNADLIEHCFDLGYIEARVGNVLDATFGLGRFWKPERTPYVWANDLHIDPESLGIPLAGFSRDDYTASSVTTGFPASWNGTFGTVVFDPPYKLNGTSTGKGPSTSDVDYGVAGPYKSVADKMHEIHLGVGHCMRVLRPGGHLLVKCQDQVVSGKVVWQADVIVNRLREQTAWKFDLVDKLYLVGHRAQPAGRRQVHARRNYSTLLVLRKKQ